MPVHNEEGNLAPTIASVSAQSFRDFELIIVNDGSTDDTARELETYARRHNWIRLYHIPSSGISRALNYGLDKAAGPYIARIDAGDIALGGWLKEMRDAIETSPKLDLLFGRVFLTDSSCRPFAIWPVFVPRNAVKAIRANKNFPHPFLAAKTETLKKVGGYPLADGYEDTALWQKLVSENVEIRVTRNIVGIMLRTKEHNDIVMKRLRARASFARWSQSETEMVILNALVHRWLVYRTGLSDDTKIVLQQFAKRYPVDYIFAFLRNVTIKLFQVLLLLTKRSETARSRTWCKTICARYSQT